MTRPVDQIPIGTFSLITRISKKALRINNGIELRNLPATKVVSVHHKGKYQDVGPSYRKDLQYATEKGYKINGPSRELYLDDPNKVPEEELLSEVQIPIE